MRVSTDNISREWDKPGASMLCQVMKGLEETQACQSLVIWRRLRVHLVALSVVECAETVPVGGPTAYLTKSIAMSALPANTLISMAPVHAQIAALVPLLHLMAQKIVKHAPKVGSSLHLGNRSVRLSQRVMRVWGVQQMSPTQDTWLLRAVPQVSMPIHSPA